MNQHDPFGELNQDDTVLDQTVLTRRSALEPPPHRDRDREVSERGIGMVLPSRSGPNPLENAAATLFNLMLRLKNTLAHPDIEGLRNQVIAQVNAFRGTLERTGIAHKTVEVASYVMCTALDDVVLNDTAWGSTSLWRQQSLLVTFHKDFRGGEEFFRLLDNLLREPAVNRDLLELMYLCLALGFQGRYRRQHAKLDEVREQLFNTLQALHRQEEPDLSPHWQGVVNKPNTLFRYVPLWVVAAVAGALLVTIYSIFLFRLNDASDPVWTGFTKVAAPPPLFGREKPTVKPPPKEGPYSRLRTFLAPEILQKRVDVEALPQGVLIRIRGDGLFESASATLNPSYNELLQRIAEALKTEPGRVLVTGHTDTIPIHTLRFPSNWKLSQARAETVAQSLIAATGAPDRFTVRGEATSKPLCPNRTAAGRACNRRVEVVLMASRP